MALGLPALLAFACGPGEETAQQSGGASQKQVQRIFPTDRIYSVDDLKAVGFKVMNEYAVTEFPKAQTAYHGAFDKLEYEARFYSSHAEAVEFGGGPADEVSGPDSVIVGPDVKYQEGAPHRRLCSRAAETPHSGCSYSPRYGDFIIQGNMVLLCEGAESVAALAACGDLTRGLPQ